MQAILLPAHNLLRWLVILAGLLMLIITYRGWNGGISWRKTDERLNRLFVASVDLEVFLGALLYVTSRVTQPAFHDFGQLLKLQLTRFFGLEHPLAMILALIFVHAGSTMARAAEGPRKFRRAAIMYTLALLTILAAIPWWRPFFRVT